MNAMISIAMLACVASCAFALVDFPDNTYVMGAPGAVAQPATGARYMGPPAMGASMGVPMAVPMGMQMGYPYAAGSSSNTGSISPLLALLLLGNGGLTGSSSSSSGTDSSSLIQTLVLLSLFSGNGSGSLLG